MLDYLKELWAHEKTLSVATITYQVMALFMTGVVFSVVLGGLEPWSYVVVGTPIFMSAFFVYLMWIAYKDPSRTEKKVPSVLFQLDNMDFDDELNLFFGEFTVSPDMAHLWVLLSHEYDISMSELMEMGVQQVLMQWTCATQKTDMVLLAKPDGYIRFVGNKEGSEDDKKLD